jgi:hypothetical protein
LYKQNDTDMKNIENMTLIEKVEWSARLLQSDGNFSEDQLNYIFSEDKEYHTIREKMNNLSDLFKENLKSGTIETLLDLDFETEIWELI